MLYPRQNATRFGGLIVLNVTAETPENIKSPEDHLSE